MNQQQRFIDGPAGRLDSRWHGPDDGYPVILLHPHPLHGGTMGSRFTYELAQALAADDFLVVRFNYRGVGRSEGTYDRGNGETDDALAVWELLARETGQPPAVVGHSFGGGVAIRLSRLRDVPAMVAVAAPAHVRDSDLHPIDEAPEAGCPAELVIGTDDDKVPLADVEAISKALPACGHVHVLQGIGHFLVPEDNPRGVAAVRRALARLLHP